MGRSGTWQWVGTLVVLGSAALLGGCADNASADSAAERVGVLEQRVTRLQAEVERLRGEVQALRGGQNAARVTDLAGARTCALDLARTLEAYRSDNGRYPNPSEITLPGACADLRVDWQKLAADAYAFDVRGRDGALLTHQASE